MAVCGNEEDKRRESESLKRTWRGSFAAYELTLLAALEYAALKL